MFPPARPALWFEIAGSCPFDRQDYVYHLYTTDGGTVSFTYYASTQYGVDSGSAPALYGPAPSTFVSDSGASLAELLSPR